MRKTKYETEEREEKFLKRQQETCDHILKSLGATKFEIIDVYYDLINDKNIKTIRNKDKIDNSNPVPVIG